MKRPAPQPVHITDHAVLRYLQRKCGINIEQVRAEIAAITDEALQSGACGLKHEGMNYRFENGACVTVARIKSERRGGTRHRDTDE